MLSLAKLTLLLVIIEMSVKYVDGNKKVVEVSELLTTNGEDSGSESCCVYGNCSCHSLDHALANLTSNVLINITTDVTLSSLTEISHLEDLSIIGRNNPILNCKNGGRIHFTFCNNCIIQGITWDGCGTEHEPGLLLRNSSNITIQNCSFQHSRGQAVVLSEVSGDVNINHCKFVNNTHYRGHGAAIYYSFKKITYQSWFTVNECNFTHIKVAKSVIYIESESDIHEHNNTIHFYYSMFYCNQGVSLYVVNQNVYLHGKVLFQNNIAENGAGIYISDHSTVVFGETSDVAFIDNSANSNGGAVLLRNHTNILFDKNSIVTFNNNNATNGIINSMANSNVTFKANCQVTFSNNSVTEHGAAIYSSDNSHVTFTGNSQVTFSNNVVTYSGGIICCENNCIVSFEMNSNTTFVNNTAADGGAITAFNNSHISFKANSITFFGNNAAAFGSALYVHSNGMISFRGNSTTRFINNTADKAGGAIYSFNDSHIFFEGHSTVVFSNNTARGGGVIYAYKNVHVSFKANSTTLFSNSTANDGGAIYTYDNTYITFEGNSTTEFTNNSADYSGAISTYGNARISFEGNSTTIFSNNIADYGGAIAVDNSHISFEQNSTTHFSDNIANVYGGAVLVTNHSDMIYSDNSTVTFITNKLPSGREIYSNRGSEIITKGNSIVIFNGLSTKWCNNTCLAYNGESNVVTIDSSGIVWCNNQNAFLCLSTKCHCNHLENILNTTEAMVNITDDTVILSSVILVDREHYISIIGYNSLTVICVNGGGLKFKRISNLIIEGITFIGCGAIGTDGTPAVEIELSYNVTIQKCSFKHSLERAIRSYFVVNLSINHCKFLTNINYRGHGLAIDIHHMYRNDKTVISNCDLQYNGLAKSLIHIETDSNQLVWNIYLSNSTLQNNQAACIYLSSHVILYINGEVLFENNTAIKGAGICIIENCTAIFDEGSTVRFINNLVYHSGAAIFQNSQSNILFGNNSTVTFDNNKAVTGTIYSKDRSNVIFEANCQVTFSNNSATQHGSAIHSSDNSHIRFKGNSTVTFSDNAIHSNDINEQLGGTVFSENYDYISFEENSTALFSNNIAEFGAAILSMHNSNIIFKDTSRVVFNNNKAQHCGVLTSGVSSTIAFMNNTEVDFYDNEMSCSSTSYYESPAGAICTFQITDVVFSGHSLVTFIGNTGGGIVSTESNVEIEEYSVVIFNNNIAQYSSGGALVCFNNSNITIKDNSNTVFNGNKASQSGGAIHSYNMCKITFKDNSTSTFINNTARDNGGAILSDQHSEIVYEGKSDLTFKHNTADNGGTFYFTHSSMIIKETAKVAFWSNHARRKGGVGYLNLNSKVMFEGTSQVMFDNNMAEQSAGVLYCERSNISFKGNSSVTITNNNATLNGGALYFEHSSDVSFMEFTNITFSNNKALYGGAMIANNHSNITLTGNSVLKFVSNEATQSGGAGYFNSHCNFIMNENVKVIFVNNNALKGGALCFNEHTAIIMEGNATNSLYNSLTTVRKRAVIILNDSSIDITSKDYITINFTSNNAQYGAAVFLDSTAVMVNNSNKNHNIEFINNIAKISGNSVYQDVAELCNSSCPSNRILGISNEFIATPPHELKFFSPAVCIDDDYDAQCNNYYVQNVMLGREIVIPACVLDYYNHLGGSTQFLVHSERHPNYSISGPKQVLISCDSFSGIAIMGNQSLLQSMNFTIIIALNVALNADWKSIEVNLTIGLSPCHPGFWQYSKSLQCECYNANDIVFCSGSKSTIKRGYWFGSVTGKPTVTFCPINYCNFTCCETSNGYYHLSPVRDNQCRSHRSGTACGNCEEGYTLSFDSVECVHINKCSIGQTILAISLIVLYWIVLITGVLLMMHFKVGIRYLYGITYYYSVVDLVLREDWDLSNELYSTINVMSSITKVTPQFLGRMCLVKNMSGIDQLFIHYVHPTAIIIFLFIITILARRSRRLSSFVSREIIHVICCLLLLSYTSVATTSLLLMRPLTFHDVDKVYTYSSPDVEYFHGRHLVYAIVSVLFTILIVIGLPFILAVEPFLNSKINFTKVKPLLDQFQGCYKDKYRCFAAYYMICRLVIITIVIANSSNDFIAQYLLITVCVVMDLIHQIIQPYSYYLLNIFDGLILHFLILVSSLPLVQVSNSLDFNLIVGTAFALVILPSLIFIVMSLMINKKKIKKLMKYCYLKCKRLLFSVRNYDEILLDEEEGSLNDEQFYNVIGDSSRINATICEVNRHQRGFYAGSNSYRESFFEAMDDIQD